ncbi:MAG: hypothetical protein EOM85_02410 [Candidatus Moranbacteria bacterium]|nr:hypothetical protein [Candidatus Moranbacteria bacterium]
MYVFRHNVVYIPDKEAFVVVVPDSISSGSGTAEQNWRAWHNREKVFLRYDTQVSYHWFIRTTEKQEIFLFFDKDIGKCLMSQGQKFLEKTFAWEILIEILLIFIVSFSLGTLWKEYHYRGELGFLFCLIIGSALAISFTMFFFLPICFGIDILPTQPFYFSPIGMIPGLIWGYCFEEKQMEKRIIQKNLEKIHRESVHFERPHNSW